MEVPATENNRGRIRAALLMSFALALSLPFVLSASQATASSGSFSVATANKTWTAGHLKGQVNWTGCAEAKKKAEADFSPLSVQTACEWQPAVIVQPTLPSYPCHFVWNPNDPNIQIVWAGAIRPSDGSDSFDEPDATILPGVVGQRTCLIVLQKVTIHYCNGSICTDIESFADSKVLAEEFLQVEKPISKIQATQIARQKLARRFGRSWRQGSKKRISCAAKETKFTCRASWMYRGTTRRAVLTVARFR